MLEKGDITRAKIRTRTNLALHHLLAAGKAAAQIAIIEKENDGQPLGPFWDDILQHSLGVVTLSVAALECYANELWFEHAPARPDMNEVAAERISKLIDRESVLAKYSLALSLYTGKTLDMSRKPVQDIDILIKLRNGVVHFRPEWFGSQVTHEKLSNQLNGKFTPSQFFPNEPAFPRAWATKGFSIWAISSCVSFLDYFYSATELLNPLDQFIPRLKEVSGIDL